MAASGVEMHLANRETQQPSCSLKFNFIKKETNYPLTLQRGT